jgi:Ca2+-binding EF-hand superfamily protein
MRPDYSPVAIYRALDRNNDGRIDMINLKQFFNVNNIFLSEREIIALIRRMDTKADQTISLDELQDYIE